MWLFKYLNLNIMSNLKVKTMANLRQKVKIEILFWVGSVEVLMIGRKK